MKLSLLPAVALACVTAAGLSGETYAQTGTDRPSPIVDPREMPVTINNFIRAATDIEFNKYVALAGGVNRFFISGLPLRSTTSQPSA